MLSLSKLQASDKPRDHDGRWRRTGDEVCRGSAESTSLQYEYNAGDVVTEEPDGAAAGTFALSTLLSLMFHCVVFVQVVNDVFAELDASHKRDVRSEPPEQMQERMLSFTLGICSPEAKHINWTVLTWTCVEFPRYSQLQARRGSWGVQRTFCKGCAGLVLGTWDPFFFVLTSLLWSHCSGHNHPFPLLRSFVDEISQKKSVPGPIPGNFRGNILSEPKSKFPLAVH